MTEKYEDKLQKHYDAPTYEVVSTIFRGLTGRKVTIPGNYRRYEGNRLSLMLCIPIHLSINIATMEHTL